MQFSIKTKSILIFLFIWLVMVIFTLFAYLNVRHFDTIDDTLIELFEMRRLLATILDNTNKLVIYSQHPNKNKEEIKKISGDLLSNIETEFNNAKKYKFSEKELYVLSNLRKDIIKVKQDTDKLIDGKIKKLDYELLKHISSEIEQIRDVCNKRIYQVNTQLVNIEKTNEQILAISLSVVLVIVLFTTILFSYSISEPISKLQEGAKKIGNGYLDHKIEIKTDNKEITLLAEEFNEMASNLFDAYQELQNKIKELEELNFKLEEASNVKSVFLANVSHELKNPLTSIKASCAAMLSNRELEKEVKTELLQIIDKQSDRLNRLIEDLLTISKIEDKKADKIEKEPVSVQEIIEEAVKSMQLQAEEKKLSLSVNLPEEETIISGDKDRLIRVVENLISNSIKFTPRGGNIEVNCQVIEENCMVEVKDTGIGIPEKDLPRITEKFYRANHPNYKAQGTGLGLTIVKNTVKQHGGELMIKSIQGEGTVVSFNLPLLKIN